MTKTKDHRDGCQKWYSKTVFVYNNISYASAKHVCIGVMGVLVESIFYSGGNSEAW